MAVLICMHAAGSRADEALARLAGLEDNNDNVSSAFRARLRQIEHKSENESDHCLWNILAALQFKGWRGRRLKGRTLVLLIDTFLLFWYNRFVLLFLKRSFTVQC